MRPRSGRLPDLVTMKRKKTKQQKSRAQQHRARRRKAGRPYEEVVALISSAFDPSAIITRGAWETGPDGRRELDVRIEGTAGGKPTRTMIECKDYNRASTRPIGIEHVDAIESKRGDLNLDAAFICSNAGLPRARLARLLGAA